MTSDLVGAIGTSHLAPDISYSSQSVTLFCCDADGSRTAQGRNSAPPSRRGETSERR
ncbi:hypothetical protein MPC1_12890002 [Methylocella tundrae]|nr:hypothetical protein MPC1_12890002 [Methylocella tundrae]